MNELEIFKNEEFGEVRILDIKGEPWFVGKDISDALGYSETNRMTSRLDEDEIMSTKLVGMNMNSTLINESGLYNAIIGSKLQSAKKFKKWVTSEVLPTIRKTGGYVNNDDLFINTYLPFADETTKLLFKSTLQVINKQNELIEQQRPLVNFANTVANSSDNIDMNEMAKLIANEHIKLGRNRLFEILRSNKILMANNTPYQRYIDAKWFKLIETTKITSYGSKIFTKTLVTGLGQIKIIEMLKIMLA